MNTEAPTTWKALLKQRRRWEGDGPVRHFARKHVDMAKPWKAGFCASNLLMFLDGIIFNLLCGYGMVIWGAMILMHSEMRPEPYAWMTFYVVVDLAEILPFIAMMYYSRQRTHDAMLSLAIPLMPLYRTLLLGVRIFSNTAEILWRKSFTEPHVPPHVRAVTWRWASLRLQRGCPHPGLRARPLPQAGEVKCRWNDTNDTNDGEVP